MESVLEQCDLSIICPVVNCLDYTKQFIDSIRTEQEYRLIIIDNGSTDGTEAYFRSIKHEKRLLYLKQDENIGVAPAWNLGISRAIELYGSRYFFIPNNDIILRPETIDRLLTSFLVPGVVLATATNVNNGINKPENLNHVQIPPVPEITECPDFSCFMINRECIDKVGVFDENFYPAYFEDNDYHRQIKLANLKAIKNNQILYYHYGSQTTKIDDKTRLLSNSNYLKNKEYYRQKWGGYPGEETFTRPFNQ